MNSLEIKYRWADAQSSLGYPYRFPGEVTDFMKEKYSRPAVYRWTVWTERLYLTALYVGETDILAERIRQYLRPGPRQATNLRLKAFFDEALKRDEHVALQTLEFEPFQVNRVNFTMDLLGQTHIRRLFENLVLVWLHSEASSGSPLILNRVLTRDIERSKKRIDRAVAELKKLGLTDEQTKQVIQALKISKTKA